MTKSISPRMKRLLLLAALIAVVRFFVLPLHSWQEDTRSTIVNIRKQLARLESLEKSRTEMETTATKMDSLFLEIETYFQADAETAEALQLKVQKYLEDLSAEIGISVQRMEWIYVNSDELMVQTPVKILFRSNLDQLYNFLYQVESHPRFLTIDALSVSASQGNDLTGTMEISAYSLKQAQEGKVTDAKAGASEKR